MTGRLLQCAGVAGLAFLVSCSPDSGADDSADNGADDAPASRLVAEEEARASSEAPAAVESVAAESAARETAPQDGAYRLVWQSSNGVCSDVLAALNAAAPSENESAGSYAAAQAQDTLTTPMNVRWADLGDGREGATLDYFNDGVTRSVERREGMLAGHQTINLWIDDGAGQFTYLDFGHAGANTSDLPPADDRHTRLTYSVADIIDIDGRYITLISPLSDVDASGDIYAAAWAAKDGTVAPRAPADYYSYIECIAAPAADSQ